MSVDLRLFPANDEAGVMRTTRLQSGLVQRTDTTNADRLIRQFGDVIRYNPAWEKWLCWNGRYWEIDEGDIQINEYVKLMVRGIYRDMLDTDNYRERLEIEKFSVSSESMRRINACISLASKRPEVRISSDGLDTNPMLFNVENGETYISNVVIDEINKTENEKQRDRLDLFDNPVGYLTVLQFSG